MFKGHTLLKPHALALLPNCRLAEIWAAKQMNVLPRLCCFIQIRCERALCCSLFSLFPKFGRGVVAKRGTLDFWLLSNRLSITPVNKY